MPEAGPVHIQLPTHLRETYPCGAPLGDQPHYFRLELGAELAALTPPGCSGLPVSFHELPTPRN
jgi:hypothetical protein